MNKKRVLTFRQVPESYLTLVILTAAFRGVNKIDLWRWPLHLLLVSVSLLPDCVRVCGSLSSDQWKIIAGIRVYALTYKC